MRALLLTSAAVALTMLCRSATASSLVESSVVCTETMNVQGSGAPAPLHPVSGVDTTPSCTVHAGVVPGAIAIVKFSNDMNSTGWADLRVFSPFTGGKLRCFRDRDVGSSFNCAARVQALRRWLPTPLVTWKAMSPVK